MTKKKTKKKVAPKPSKEELHILNLIKHTEKNIKNDNSSLDDLWIKQAGRLKERLEALK